MHFDKMRGERLGEAANPGPPSWPRPPPPPRPRSRSPPPPPSAPSSSSDLAVTVPCSFRDPTSGEPLPQRPRPEFSSLIALFQRQRGFQEHAGPDTPGSPTGDSSPQHGGLSADADPPAALAMPLQHYRGRARNIACPACEATTLVQRRADRGDTAAAAACAVCETPLGLRQHHTACNSCLAQFCPPCLPERAARQSPPLQLPPRHFSLRRPAPHRLHRVKLPPRPRVRLPPTPALTTPRLRHPGHSRRGLVT